MTDRQTLPCREFCNHRARCAPDQCGNPYRRDDPRYWIGRGAENVPGKPFGWAAQMERQALREHLLARGWDDGVALYFRVERMRERVQRDYHRRKPPLGVRRVTSAARPASSFTPAQLRHLVDLFSDANDPVSRDIAARAAETLANATHSQNRNGTTQ